jgi:hypothetical protein
MTKILCVNTSFARVIEFHMTIRKTWKINKHESERWIERAGGPHTNAQWQGRRRLGESGGGGTCSARGVSSASAVTLGLGRIRGGGGGRGIGVELGGGRARRGEWVVIQQDRDRAGDGKLLQN